MANGCRETAELMMFGWLPLLLWLLMLLLWLLLEFAMNSVLSCDRLRFWLEPLMEECDDADGDCDKAMSRAMSNPISYFLPLRLHRPRPHIIAIATIALHSANIPSGTNDLLRPLTPRPMSDEHTLLPDCDSPKGSVCRPKLRRSLVNDFCDASGFSTTEVRWTLLDGRLEPLNSGLIRAIPWGTPPTSRYQMEILSNIVSELYTPNPCSIWRGLID